MECCLNTMNLTVCLHETLRLFQRLKIFSVSGQVHILMKTITHSNKVIPSIIPMWQVLYDHLCHSCYSHCEFSIQVFYCNLFIREISISRVVVLCLKSDKNPSIKLLGLSFPWGTISPKMSSVNVLIILRNRINDSVSDSEWCFQVKSIFNIYSIFIPLILLTASFILCFILSANIYELPYVCQVLC